MSLGPELRGQTIWVKKSLGSPREAGQEKGQGEFQLFIKVMGHVISLSLYLRWE